MSLLRRRMMMQSKSASVRTELELYDTGVIISSFGNSWVNTIAPGFRIIGSYDDANSNSYPIAVSPDKNCAQLEQRYAGARGAASFQYNGETWYVTNPIPYPFGSPYRYTSSVQTSGYLLCINDITNVSAYASRIDAAKDLLDYYYGVI